jgi:hypothetical protein
VAWQTPTIVLGTVWTGLMIVVAWMLPGVSRPVVVGSLVFPLYYFVLSFVLRRRRSPRLNQESFDVRESPQTFGTTRASCPRTTWRFRCLPSTSSSRFTGS